MKETFYVVRVFMNGRAGCSPSEFSTKEEAIEFIEIVKRMNDGTVKQEFHLYEVNEIVY